MAKIETLTANLQREKLKQLAATTEARPLRINDTTITGFYLAVGKKGVSGTFKSGWPIAASLPLPFGLVRRGVARRAKHG